MKAHWPGLGRSVARMGFGCWQLAGAHRLEGRPQGWGRVDRSDALRMVHDALAGGIELFDTAAAYGDGVSEEILGQALATSSERMRAVVCTKIPLNAEEEAAGRLLPSFATRCEESLRRLRSDRIDILLLHNPADGIDWSTFDSTLLRDLQRAGKIGIWGVSCRSLRGARNVMARRFGQCVEWVFHLLERRPVDALLPGLRAAGMSFIARSPLSRGLLSQRHLSGTAVRFETDEFRSTLSPDWIAWTIAGAKALAPMAAPAGGISAAALRFALSYDGVSAVIPGIRTHAQLGDAIAAGSMGPLPPEMLESIERTAPRFYPPWGDTPVG